MSSREFAKKNRQMSIQLAIDETRFTKKRCARMGLYALDPGERRRCTRVATGEKWRQTELESSWNRAEVDQDRRAIARRRAPGRSGHSHSRIQRLEPCKRRTRRAAADPSHIDRRIGRSQANRTGPSSPRAASKGALLLVPSALQKLSLLMLTHLLTALLDHTAHWMSPCSAPSAPACRSINKRTRLAALNALGRANELRRGPRRGEF